MTSKKRVEADQGDHQTPEKAAEIQEVLELTEKAGGRNQLENPEGYSEREPPGDSICHGSAALRVENQRDIRQAVRTVGSEGQTPDGIRFCYGGAEPLRHEAEEDGSEARHEEDPERVCDGSWRGASCPAPNCSYDSGKARDGDSDFSDGMKRL